MNYHVWFASKVTMLAVEWENTTNAQHARRTMNRLRQAGYESWITTTPKEQT